MNPLDFIPKTVLAAAIAVLMVMCGLSTFRNLGLTHDLDRAAVTLADLRATNARDAADAHAALSARTTEFRNREQVLTAAANTERKTYEKKLADATDVANALRLRLENTAFGTMYTPTIAETATATGIDEAPRGGNDAELRRPFGLVDEALRAEKVRLALLGCYRIYDAAAETLSK